MDYIFGATNLLYAIVLAIEATKTTPAMIKISLVVIVFCFLGLIIELPPTKLRRLFGV